MVASRKKLKQAEAKAINGDETVEALKIERKSKVKKRKEAKHQAAKRAKGNGNVEIKDDKSQAEEVNASPEGQQEEKQTKKIRKKEKQKKRRTAGDSEKRDEAGDLTQETRRADVEVTAEIPEEEMVLNVSNAGDEANEQAGMKRKAGDDGKPKNKKKGNKKKKLDKWGAPVAEAPVQDSQENGEQQVDQRKEQPLYEPRKIYVGGMPYNTSEDDIHNYFAECGAIEELDCSTFPDTGKFSGIAFITFKTEAAVPKAIELDGADMGGRYLRIERCKIKQQGPKEQTYQEPPPKTQGCLSVYIGNLSWEVTEDDVRRFFKACNIKAVRFASDKATGDFKGYGHVDFYDDESVDAAVKLDQQLLLGRPTKVAYAVVPKQNSARTSSSASKQCYVCREEGHVSFQCPKNVQA